MMDLNGKVAIVTGGKRGIGKAISKILLKEGVNLAMCSKNEEDLDLLEKELKIVANNSPLCRAVDIRNGIAVSSFIQEVYRSFGKIDILINNAATIRSGLLEEMTEEDWELLIDTNLKGSFLTMKYVIPYMKQNSSGSILNICSGLSKKAYPNFSIHCASKFGLRGMSLAVKEELRKYNIQVMILNPSSVDTDIWNYIEGDYNHRKMVSSDEVADSVLFMLKNSTNCTIDELDIAPRQGIALQ
ncbi:MAG: SDR family oxidoreductase [Symploca sp. SIO2G7]|nr:SDR family oxidoreductase [Symploca sp. SIO2G7]